MPDMKMVSAWLPNNCLNMYNHRIFTKRLENYTVCLENYNQKRRGIYIYYHQYTACKTSLKCRH